MNDVYHEMKAALEEFMGDKAEFDCLLDDNENELLNANRVIKKEVVDMSDLMEKMSKIILTQNQKINEISTDMKDIKNLLLGQVQTV